MDQKVPKLKHGIGYGEKDGFDAELDIWDQLDKEKKIEAKKGTLKETFTRKGTTYPYKGTPEPILMDGEVILGFEIFADYVNKGKRVVADETSVIMEELVVAEEEPEEVVAIPESKATDDQNEESDLEAYVLNSIMDVFYDDYDVSFTALFETHDLFYSKVDAMKSDFAYLCDVSPNSYSVCDDHFMHMFGINSVQTESFNLGTNENPKNILLASDLTPEEREKMKEILKNDKKYLLGVMMICLGLIERLLNIRFPHILTSYQSNRSRED